MATGMEDSDHLGTMSSFVEARVAAPSGRTQRRRHDSPALFVSISRGKAALHSVMAVRASGIGAPSGIMYVNRYSAIASEGGPY